MNHPLAVALQAQGWQVFAMSKQEKVQLRSDLGIQPDQDLTSSSLQALCRDYAYLRSLDECCWFLTDWEKSGLSDSAFAVDEFKKQSLDAAINPQQETEILAFWAQHQVILMSVYADYAFVAYVLSGADQGKIVMGMEPEYEEVDIIFDSFEHFTQALMAHVNGAEHAVFTQLFSK